MDLDLTGLPDRWNAPTQTAIDAALKRTMAALANDRRHGLDDRLRAYYTVDGDYAGSAFLEIPPLEATAVTPSDLFAVSLLNVKISPYAARQFFTRDSDRQEFARLLSDDALPMSVDLTTAGPDTFRAMEELYCAVKWRLSLPTTRDPNARVTASKICSRKRPALFPVRDTVVRHYLGLDAKWSWQSDWVVFRHLIGQDVVISALEESAARLRGEDGIILDKYRLRWLDVALWTHAIDAHREEEDE